ncbi:uncharacterized protein PV06_03796 [Exophiala oligosperma]|uniref:Cytomegalovirus gH-receptor family protein n=1 Tax=Exophiala oligosperma TaxID=215243 RepID=A0A0D2C6I3_9EURO|nr:uncharacterized protein PV06_03796 [Exophiala oligosperma]KIW45402.1 hypothetical protein PV06_03796 [Exophiala oligosperma]
MDGHTDHPSVPNGNTVLYREPLNPIDPPNSLGHNAAAPKRPEPPVRRSQGVASSRDQSPMGLTTRDTRLDSNGVDGHNNDMKGHKLLNSALLPENANETTKSPDNGARKSPSNGPENARKASGSAGQRVPWGTTPDGYKGMESPSHPENVLKLSPEKLQDLTASPESLPLRAIDSTAQHHKARPSPLPSAQLSDVFTDEGPAPAVAIRSPLLPSADMGDSRRPRHLTIETGGRQRHPEITPSPRPGLLQRAISTPGSIRSPQSPQKGERVRPTLVVPDGSSRTEGADGRRYSSSGRPLPSPMPTSIPLPPLSLPTYLQLELSSQRPSQLYIHRSAASDFPYESSRAKIERLMNFLLLPPHLEGVLWFGILACLDSWLYIFTILPLRLLKSIYILVQSWTINLTTEVHFVSSFVYQGTGRMWKRRRSSIPPNTGRKVSEPSATEPRSTQNASLQTRRQNRHHRRTKSVPSALLPDDKADLLRGLLILTTCTVLLRLDASRMYHWVRGQAAIKLYVIYNILEVCDRLFSAIGQDVLECLFSREALERKPDGHSKILRPFWLFVLALVYTVIHSVALFYQVITLNVAVNSYSNALITLLMSNQFVEIKGTVFKKFEKENLFQLTCADVVERFQLWHMLVIIAARNIVETGGLSSGLSALMNAASATASAPSASNSSLPLTGAVPPRSASSILPSSFTLLPAVVNSITSYAPAVSQVLGPFFVVLGSEMLVDWLKHAYINKFNNTRPAIYDRFLDVLAKDYYTNAFGDQNLTKRLGLPVIPLSCLFIRASVQTYQMFMAAWVPSTAPSSSTSLASIYEDYSAARSSLPLSTSATISRTVDDIIRSIPTVITKSSIVTHMTTVLMFLLLFLILLACKLVLGMVLLAFARSRYHSMKSREKNTVHHVEGGRRVGGWGVVEVDEDKRRWIYEDDAAGLRALREKEERDKNKQQKEKERGHGVDAFDKVKRYEMVAKRIW